MGAEPIHIDEAIEAAELGVMNWETMPEFERDDYSVSQAAEEAACRAELAAWEQVRDGVVVTDDTKRADRAEQALRNVAAACNQLEGYPNLSRERQVELVQAIRRFTGVERSVLRSAVDACTTSG